MGIEYCTDDTCSALHVNLITEPIFVNSVFCWLSMCFFVRRKGERDMPQTSFQRKIFALLTVIITVHAYVFYSLYVVNGATLMAVSGQNSVLAAINAMGGVYMCGRSCPIWAVVLLEFVLAYSIELLIGSPCSFKLACKCFDPRSTHPVLFETAIICATVGLMCPIMSFIATFLYFPYYNGFNLLTALADFLKHVCHNFPFAFFSQLFFIQPLVRTLFKAIFKKQLTAQH